MNRVKITSFVKSGIALFRSQVEAFPVIAFFVGVGLGTFLVIFWDFVYPVLVLLLILAGGVWLFSEDPKTISSHQAPDQA